MPKVVHTLVDSAGRTNFDEFSIGDLSLDMDSPPKEYHVFINNAANSSLIAERFRECDNGKNDKAVYLCCPVPKTGNIAEWETAKPTIRELVFEGPSPFNGGFRKAVEQDYIMARLVAMFTAANTDVMQQLSAIPQEKLTDDMIKNICRSVYAEKAPQDVAIATISSHRLWKRLSWINGMFPEMFLHLVGTLVDPTWYINPSNPKSCGRFKEFCGCFMYTCDSLRNTQAGLYHLLSNQFAQLMPKKIPEEVIRHPSAFFLRYGLKCVQQHLDSDIPTLNAWQMASLQYVRKIVGYIWLNWMEVVYRRPPVALDDEKFFGTDVEAKEYAYRASFS